MTNEIRTIDVDLIRELRAGGNHWEAQKMIEAFRRDVEEDKKNVVRDQLRKDRLVKAHFHMCSSNYCRKEVVEGEKWCEVCLKNRRKYYDKKRRVVREGNPVKT